MIYESPLRALAATRGGGGGSTGPSMSGFKDHHTISDLCKALPQKQMTTEPESSFSQIPTSQLQTLYHSANPVPQAPVSTTFKSIRESGPDSWARSRGLGRRDDSELALAAALRVAAPLARRSELFSHLRGRKYPPTS